ncbi:CHAT domain-containing protein [Streptomyces sp. NPDC059718]
MSHQQYDLDALMREFSQAAPQGTIASEDLPRLTALVLEHLGCTTGAEAYDMVYADWKALPRGSTRSGLWAGQILLLLQVLRLDERLTDPRRKDELLREARAHGPSGQDWQHTVLIASTSSGVQQIESVEEMEAALAQLEQARSKVAADGPQRLGLELNRAGLRIHLAQMTGAEDDFDSAVDDYARLVDSASFPADQRLAASGQLAGFRARQAARREDEPELARHIGSLESVLARLPADHPERLSLQSYLDNTSHRLALLEGRRTGRPPSPRRTTAQPTMDDLRQALSTLPRGPRADKLFEQGVSRSGNAVVSRDYAAAIEAQQLLEEALELFDPDDGRWLRVEYTLGLSHSSLATLSIAPNEIRMRHLDQGISWLRHALRLAQGPENTVWGVTAMALARACRFRGDVLHPTDPRGRRRNHDEARRLGLASLGAVAWTVMLQSGTTHAADTARRAGEQAVEVARWALADNALTDAVRALDAGRGLTLHAATVATTVPDMLTTLGRRELADEWRNTGHLVMRESGDDFGTGPGQAPPSRLRRQVMQALAASPLRRRLLDTPAPEQIARSLQAMGTTALVYLIPADQDQPSLADRFFFGRPVNRGTAVLVLSNGTTSALELPQLSLDAPVLLAYRTWRTAGRDAGGPPLSDTPEATPRTDTSRASLNRLSQWAGSAVMEPLLKHLPKQGGHRPSIALIPMAELAAVPWHAALLPGPRGTRRYAFHEADISYTPSSRLLCEVAERTPTGIHQALVIGNPNRDLYHAGEEAEAIHRTFHSAGELLGPGTATPGAVAEWLLRQRGGLLHLACHGVVEPGARHSASLHLSGGRLAAEELTEGTARYKHLELVVLAACRTNVSGHGYDEAYSLSTAFLVAGSRTVIGSLWPVPDDATSLLMYMTHHFIARDRLAPGQALRAAQSWMLDDRRQPPPDMPLHLRARVDHIRGDDLTAWAGFMHLGW